MKIYITIFIALLFCSTQLHAQADTLICYDCRTKQIEIISLPSVNSTKEYDYTDWDIGQTTGLACFDTSAPENLPNNWTFTDIVPAQSLFDISYFPVSTTVKIFRFVNDTTEHWCSGTMISENLVLTCAHGVYAYLDNPSKTFVDSFLVAPAFDNRNFHPLFGSAKGLKFYLPKDYYERNTLNDIAVIELDQPLGIQTGWMGIEFNSNSNFFDNKVFHKFSYTDGYSHRVEYNPDSLEICMRDTLYYNYGTLANISDRPLGFSFLGWAFGGQSGSSIFDTDNLSYCILGILHGGSELSTHDMEIVLHYRFTKNMFYAVKNIIEKSVTTLEPVKKMQPAGFSLDYNYPNPFNSNTTIQFALPEVAKVTLKIYNISGQEVATLFEGIHSAGKYKIQWLAEGLPSGIYLAQLKTDTFSKTMKMILQK